jgi:hypothetical protein
MPLRPCLGLIGESCGKLTAAAHSRCPDHQRRHEAARKPSARQRGYDAEHDRTRAHLLPLAYGKPCPRCGQPMLPGQALDLGHRVARAVDPHCRADRMEHASCNRSAGDGA